MTIESLIMIIPEEGGGGGAIYPYATLFINV